MPKPDRPRLTLEDYVLFFTTRTGQGLTLDHINQIIHMHAFVKLHREKKPVMVDLLRSVDLLRPRRSTVSLNATSPPPGAAPAAAASLSTEEATRDIEDLGWRECPVGSLLSVRAGRMALTPAPAATASPVPLASLGPAPGFTVERVSPPSLLSASSPLPPALPAPARRKRSMMGTGKAAVRMRKRRVMELLTLPSIEMATSG